MLLQAFREVRTQIPDAYLLLVGGGPWQKACRRLIERLELSDRVRITGFLGRPEVFDCVAEADAFAFPSVTDTQGLVVLEAMALGRPTVAVQSGAVADVLRHDVDGLLVPPTGDDLAGGIVRLLEQPQTSAPASPPKPAATPPSSPRRRWRRGWRRCTRVLSDVAQVSNLRHG